MHSRSGSLRQRARARAIISARSIAVVSTLLIAIPVSAEDAEKTRKLAEDSQNPISSLISVPFENNINYNAGPQNNTDNVLTIKPVYPTAISENWNLINRALIPIVSRASRAPGEGREVGLGDIVYQGFFSPKKPTKGIIWGVGPTALFRTGTGDLSSDQWGIGPNAVALTIRGPVVAGVLISNIWSVVGDDGAKDVSQGTMQPFLNYNLDAGWYLSSAPVITANWKAKNDQTWTIPVGGGLGRVFRLGKQPLDARLAGFYNVERPDKASDWTLQLQVKFLFPKGS